MDNVLITGASGFIGSFLVEEGLRRGFTVYAGIRKTSSKEYLTDPSIRFLEMDFSSEDKVIQTLDECKVAGIRFKHIVHNAGLTKAQKKEAFTEVNVNNTRNFVTALQRTDMMPEKFIYISSLAAYGPGDPATMEPVKLAGPARPIELYGKSKLEAETWLQAQPDLPWIFIRPTGVYGPREKDYFVFFQTISRGIEAYIGSDRQILTFIYVKDLVRVVFDAIASPFTRKAWFVSDGKEYTAREFSDITKKHLNKKTILLVVPTGIVKQLAVFLEGFYSLWGSIPTLNTDKYRVLSSTNWRCEVKPLQDDLHFKAEYDLDRGVEDALEWYRSHHWL